MKGNDCPYRHQRGEKSVGSTRWSLLPDVHIVALGSGRVQALAARVVQEGRQLRVLARIRPEQNAAVPLLHQLWSAIALYCRSSLLLSCRRGGVAQEPAAIPNALSFTSRWRIASRTARGTSADSANTVRLASSLPLARCSGPSCAPAPAHTCAWSGAQVPTVVTSTCGSWHAQRISPASASTARSANSASELFCSLLLCFPCFLCLL